MLLCEAAYIESWISPIISDWLLYISGHRSLYNIRCKQVTAFQKKLTWLKISLLVKKKNEILSSKVNFKIFLRPLKYLILLYIIFNTNDHPPLKTCQFKNFDILEQNRERLSMWPKYFKRHKRRTQDESNDLQLLQHAMLTSQYDWKIFEWD